MKLKNSTFMISLTETHRIKEEIKENPSKIAQILESTKIGICITDSNACFVMVNKAYCQVYGYSEAELIGNPFTIVVPDEYKEMMNFLHKKFLDDKHEISRQWTVQRKDGELIEISVDTAYSAEIFDQSPHKITFVQREV